MPLVLADLWCICAYPCGFVKKMYNLLLSVFGQKMLRVKDEEFSLRERRDNSYHRRRRYSDDYDSEAELYQQYKMAGLEDNMVAEQLT